MVTSTFPAAYLPAPAETSRRQVVHLTAEYWPLAQTGGLAEAVAGLARAQHAAGMDVSVILPSYRFVRGAGRRTEPWGPPLHVRAGGGATVEVRIHEVVARDAGPRIYLIEHAPYFDRPGLYGQDGVDYADNPARFAFFSRAALALLPHITRRRGAIVHAHDWHTALAPYFLASGGDDAYGTVFTVHNAAYQGVFSADVARALHLDPADSRLRWFDAVNPLKAGLTTSRLISTVSPGHAAELRSPQGGFGLHEIFRGLGDRFVGIMNGVDHRRWNPQTDPAIAARYCAAYLDGKRACKRALQRAYGLDVNADALVLVASARLVEQKGFDLLLGGALDAVPDAQCVILGRGDPHYETALRSLQDAAPDRVAVPLTFSDAAEHQLLAGGDALLMPSLFEPCGLTQMRGLRYGTVPIVRNVGGLADSVEDEVTGFLFDAFTVESLAAALRRAREWWADPTRWRSLVRTGMLQDVSWRRSIRQLEVLYQAVAAAQPAPGPPIPASRRRTRQPFRMRAHPPRLLPAVAQGDPLGGDPGR